MMKSLQRLKAIASVVALLAATLIMPLGAVEAQQPASLPVERGARAAQGVYLIRNARIVTVSGPVIEQGSLLIRSGKIEAVGTVTAPADAQVIDASGLTVYPGMIDMGTSLGLVEISSGAPGTVDLAEIGDMNPDAQAIVAINPHSAHFGVTRVAGVTSA